MSIIFSLFFSFWSLSVFAQQLKTAPVKKWNPQTSGEKGKSLTKGSSPGSSEEPPCIDGDDCMDRYGVKTAEEARKIILNKERVIKKRVGPGPVS
ncbi:MAG: hypothetical protein D6713_09610 [Deltaproteobacteria bacterium]|nr:MAG: hypothetical protein D6713_09610 [Deltaproteobacteria bacterium]